jgi:hypothetical protein
MAWLVFVALIRNRARSLHDRPAAHNNAMLNFAPELASFTAKEKT